MADPVLALLEQQSDLCEVKALHKGSSIPLYIAKQHYSEGERQQVIQVLDNLQNHYTIKREKDLLHYLDQFENFARFNEIRKVDFHYLQFFDLKAKRTLKQHVAKKGVLAENAWLRLLQDMISILEKVHQVGFVHTAIEPGRIWVSKQHFYLMDWRQAIPALSSYESALLPADNRYTPPERLHGQCDAKGDIYQLGCTLYYALTGKHIYRLDKVKDPYDQMWAHSHHTIRKVEKLPVYIRYLLLWMTQKDPKKRPSLAELKQWTKDFKSPKWVRKQTLKPVKGFPDNTLLALADEHYPYALYQRARLLEAQGDLTTAFNLYENGAFKEYVLAEAELARLYLQGFPVEASEEMAAHLFHSAYQQGHPQAAFELARLYETGQALKPNAHKAFELNLFAAQRGHLEAQYNVALAFHEGSVVTGDEAQALSWMKLAAHYGYKPAQTALQNWHKAALHRAE
jgi:hypothetical protein